MIYVLYSATGSYDDYHETAEYYFTNEHDADKALEKLLAFNKYVVGRIQHLNYWKAIRVYEAAYRKIGVTSYIDGGISWFIKPLKCGNTLECLR
jgi:hypothetical protein